VLAIEILTNIPAVANVIREGRSFMLPGIIQTGRKQGMRLMDDSLRRLQEEGVISAEEMSSRFEHKP
jgi:twitching motility protein PilT